MKTYIKKAAALLVILAAVLTAMPQTVRAGDEYGFEILVEPSPAPIGGEVTLTVRLTDYDETKAGIRGFQIDIYNVGNTLQNSKCTTLVTDNDSVLSNYTSYQPGRDLVRHLYMKWTGTMDRSQKDLLQVVVPIDETLTEAGSVTLPFCLLIQTDAKEDNQLTYYSDIVISYAPEEELPESSVEITWGNMDYVYTDGIWNPAEHRYEGGGWTDNGSGCVTVKNTGDAAVETSFTYTTERADISGSFTAADDPVTGPVTVAGGEEQTVHLILNGAPSESLEEQTVIGNVSVTLGGS